MKTSIVLSLILGTASLTFGADHGEWVATWGASPAKQLGNEQKMRDAKLVFENQTLREVVHTSLGGQTVRVRLSNAYGDQPLEIGGAHIALRTQDSQIASGSDHPVTFSGQRTITIPPNALALSDPVNLTVPALGDVAISIFLPKAAVGAGIHYAAQQTIYIGSGDKTGADAISNPQTITSWVFLTGVDVLASSSSAGTLVAFGDSITDGARSAIDANHRWPNFLAERLLAKGKHEQIGILDAGIGGNRILHDAASNIQFGVNALARFDRDVLSQPNVKYIIVLEGINDLGHAGSSEPASETVSAEDLIAGFKQMIERAHEKKIKIFGATLTPFEGARTGYFTPEKEVKRKTINEWIRTGGAFDGVIDFEQAVRDPNAPTHMLAAYDSGDHLHPNDAGYKAMGDAINLSLFK